MAGTAADFLTCPGKILLALMFPEDVFADVEGQTSRGFDLLHDSPNLILPFDTVALKIGLFRSNSRQADQIQNITKGPWVLTIPFESVWVQKSLANYGSEGSRFNSWRVHQTKSRVYITFGF